MLNNIEAIHLLVQPLFVSGGEIALFAFVRLFSSVHIHMVFKVGLLSYFDSAYRADVIRPLSLVFRPLQPLESPSFYFLTKAFVVMIQEIRALLRRFLWTQQNRL